MRTLSYIQIILFTLILMVSIPFSSFAVDGQIKLTLPVPPASFPIVINRAGSYVLTSNISLEDQNLNAIEITVNDVTLDLNGHKIQGPHTGSPWGGSGNGISAENKYNITIKNGRIWGFGGDGVHLYSHFQDPTFESAGHQVDRIQASNNGQYGIQAYGCLITNCTANNNNISGIRGNNATVTNCTANKNVLNGINVDGSTIINCTANGNNDVGISSSGSTITNCTALNNATYGVACTTSTIINCTTGGNGDGFSIFESILMHSSANNNSGNGISVGQKNRIEGNNVSQNGGYGIHLPSVGIITAIANYVIKNTGSSNTSGNFQDDGVGNYMPLAGDNANYGF